MTARSSSITGQSNGTCNQITGQRHHPATNFHTFPNTGSLNFAGLGGGTAVASSDVTRGVNSTLKLTTAAGVNAEVRKTAAFDMRNRKMGIWVYVPDYTQWSSFLIYVGSANFVAFSNFTYNFASADKQYNGWHFIDTQPDAWTLAAHPRRISR